MKDVLSKIEKDIKSIGDNLRFAQKQMKSIRNLYDNADFLKMGIVINNSLFAGAMQKLGLDNLYTELRGKQNEYASSSRISFDNQLILACNGINLKDVTGNSMDGFRIRGIVGLRLYFQKGYAEIKTSALSKRIESFDPLQIAQELKKEIDRLFERPFDAKIFLSMLFKAYKQLETDTNKSVLLKEVHKVIWIEKQKDDFFEASDAKKIVSYPLDEFSVDLGKLMESKIYVLDNGYSYKIALGSGGVNVYRPSGEFNAYKYLTFERRGGNGQ